MTGRTRHIPMPALSLTLVAAAAFTLPVQQGAGQQSAAQARCDLVAAYGTVIVVPGGRELEVTDDGRPGLLEGVRLCVESLLDPDTLAAYRHADASISPLVQTVQDRADRNLIRVEIAALLSQDVFVGRLRAVARRVAGGVEALALAVKRQSAEAVLMSSGLSPADAKGGQRHDAATYVKACRKVGIPVPGSLTTDAGWSEPVDLDMETNRFLILREKTDANVWSYKDVSGGYCLTLRRQDPDKVGELPLIGTICVNADETHACFFDNIVPDGSSKRRLSLEEYQSTNLSSLLHPMDGDDDCSTCHIGANPFMVDPRTLLGKTIAEQYGPRKGGEHFAFAGLDMIEGGWSNLGLLNGAGCMQCHGLPDIPKDDRFCATIIQEAANTTMPPGYWEDKSPNERKPLWPDSDGCFDSSLADLANHFDREAIFDSLRQIKSICSGKKVPMCPSSDGMAISGEP